MRVYGYVRVSTKGQAPGTSLDEQTAEILKKYPTAVIVREVASGASERLEFAKVCISVPLLEHQNKTQRAANRQQTMR